MGMTIDEAIENNKNLRMYMEITDKESEYKFLKENYEALDTLIDVARKYQKIEQIVKSKTTRIAYDSGFRQIKKVVEDGTN